MAETQASQSSMAIFWLAFCAVQVFFMQEGFYFLESGGVRRKNTLNVAVKNASDMMICLVVFGLAGYAIMARESAGGFIGTDKFGLSGVESPLDSINFLLYGLFAATTAAIYPLVAHWAWHTEDWLAQSGFIDFAGSTVVHSVGAWVALAGVLLPGARHGRFNKDGSVNEIYGHDLMLTTMGALFLWLGWFGFSGGGLAGVSDGIAAVFLATAIASAAGGVANLLIAKVFRKQVRIENILYGILGGLVAITASADQSSVIEALFVGAMGGLLAYYGHLFLLHVLKLDDPVAAISVHGFAGI